MITFLWKIKLRKRKTTIVEKSLGKRGQVTVFILLGILILIITGGIYYTITRQNQTLEPKETEVPSQAESVNLYVKQCVDRVLQQAKNIIGRQGGYIELPQDPVGVGEFKNYLPLSLNNKIVYWYYKADNNVDFIQKPSIESMESEIKTYVDNNLLNCLGEFNEYRGFTVRKGKINTIADVQKSRVVVKVDFPVRINKGDFNFNFDVFYGEYNVPLGELFSIAEKVFNKEQDDYFLEKKTLDMMSVYKEIPYVGEVDSCIAPIWAKYNVVKDFKRILRENTLVYKVKGTDYVLSRDKNSYYEIDAGVKDAKDVHASFLFSEYWPFTLDVFPEENGLLKGYSVTEKLGEARGLIEAFVCMSTYEFIYNVQYPVLVILNKKDYTFQFGNMVVIDKNKPRENTDEFFVVDKEYDQRFCQKQIQFNVDAVDEKFNALDDVEIKSKCITHSCNLGKSLGGVWNGQVPLCINGEITGEKEGYHFGRAQISTNEPGSALLVLEKLRKMKVAARVIRMGSGDIREGEKVFISLEERNKKFSRFIVYPEQDSVELIPGVYTAKIFMTSPISGGLNIPSKTINNCAKVPTGAFGAFFGITEEKCEDVTIPSTTIDQIMTGTKDFTFLVTENDFNKNKLIFYVPYYGVVKDVTDINKLMEQEGKNPEFE